MRFARWGTGRALRVAAIYDRRLGASRSRKIPGAPVREAGDFDLDALIAQITIENGHEEICTGSCSRGNVA